MFSSPEPDPEGKMALILWPLWACCSASLGNLLHTNLPPSEQEANLQKTELSDACDALEELDQKIEQAQTGALLLLKACIDICPASSIYLTAYI